MALEQKSLATPDKDDWKFKWKIEHVKNQKVVGSNTVIRLLYYLDILLNHVLVQFCNYEFYASD